MDELEITQPEENTESAEVGETTERTEEQTLQDATHEPGARVEETQDFALAESVEEALREAMDPAEEVAGVSPVPLPKPAGEVEDDLPAPSTDPKDLPQGSGTLEPDESYPEEPQEAIGTPEVWDDMVEEGSGTYGANPGVPEGDSGWLGTGDDDNVLAEPTPVDVIEVPDGVEIKPVGEDDGTVGRDDHPVNEDLDDLEYEPGPVQQPPDWDHGPPGPTAELKESGPAGVAEVPQNVEFKPAGEDDGTVDRDDHPIEKDPDLSPAPGEPKEDEYYVDARGVIRSEGEGAEDGDKHSISDKDDDPEPLPLEPPDPDPA